MIERTFTAGDQAAFAILSGDFNPVHLDPLVARRTLFGRRVVHGIHALLWALARWRRETGIGASWRLRSLKAVFSKPMGVNESVQWHLVSGSESPRLELRCGGATVVSIRMETEISVSHKMPNVSGLAPETGKPNDVSKSEIEGRSGVLELSLDSKKAAQLFPELESFSREQFAFLLATTRLVGMECPGLHSVYSELELESDRNTSVCGLEYRVQSFDARFSRAVLTVVGPGIKGRITAFLRPKPVSQPAFSELREQVEPGAFTDQKALVIGGSRGLGEVTAKLLAAGGAETRITYYRGRADATHIIGEITALGGNATSACLDVIGISPETLTTSLRGFRPTHLYYFATPFIFSATKCEFSAELFRAFCDYYVIGFSMIVRALIPFGLRGVFYPSSVAVDETPADMGEYAAAKAAGESICGYLERSHRGLAVYRPRLLRMETDQTANFMPVQNQDPVSLMKKCLEAFARRCRG